MKRRVYKKIKCAACGKLVLFCNSGTDERGSVCITCWYKHNASK